MQVFFFAGFFIGGVEDFVGFFDFGGVFDLYKVTFLKWHVNQPLSVQVRTVALEGNKYFPSVGLLGFGLWLLLGMVSKIVQLLFVSGLVLIEFLWSIKILGGCFSFKKTLILRTINLNSFGIWLSSLSFKAAGTKALSFPTEVNSENCSNCYYDYN